MPVHWCKDVSVDAVWVICYHDRVTMLLCARVPIASDLCGVMKRLVCLQVATLDTLMPARYVSIWQ